MRERGDVFQITEKHGRKGWIGCFVIAEKVATWGIQGLVSCPGETHEQQNQYWIRLKWDEIEFVGKAPLITEDSTHTEA